MRDQTIGECALSRTRSPGDTDDMCIAGAGIGLGQDIKGRWFARFDDAEDPGQSASVTVEGVCDKRIRIPSHRLRLSLR